MGFGWLGVADLALKLFKGFAEGKAKKNQAQAVKTADEQKYKNEGDYWRAKEAHRATGVDLASSLLSGMQGSYGKGAPNYTLPPEIAGHMREARPFPGSMPADPTKGTTWNLLAGLAGGGAKLAETAALGRMTGSSNPSGNPTSLGGGNVPGGNADDSTYATQGFGGGQDRARVCALAPSLPGCPNTGASDRGDM